MTIRRLDRSEWNGFCVHASRVFIGKQVAIEVASLQLGSQLQANRMPLLGIAYDPRNDVLELILGDLDHLIPAPRELYVDEAPLGILSFEVIDADGVRQIVTLRDPLMLPGPAAFRE